MRGRTFTERDDGARRAVVIINEAMAKQFWPKGDPLNDRLVDRPRRHARVRDEPERQIIGIVADSRDGGLNRIRARQMYIPQAQVPDAANALNVRLTPIAWVVRTRSSRTRSARRPGAAAAGDRPARRRRARRWTRSSRARRRASASTCC